MSVDFKDILDQGRMYEECISACPSFRGTYKDVVIPVPIETVHRIWMEFTQLRDTIDYQMELLSQGTIIEKPSPADAVGFTGEGVPIYGRPIS